MGCPLPGYVVTTPFGVPGSWAAGYHTGEDYSTHGSTGKRVEATRAGRVVGVGNVWGSDYGKQVVVESGGVRHGYCHLSGIAVDVGDQVEAGGKLGESGNTGNSTGPHLHYEERTAPYGYADHRRPQFSTDDQDGGDDVTKYGSFSGPGLTLKPDTGWHRLDLTTEHADAGDIHNPGKAALHLDARYVAMAALRECRHDDPGATVLVRWAKYDGDTDQLVSASSPHEYVLSTGETDLRDTMVGTCGAGQYVRVEALARVGKVTVAGVGVTVTYWP